MPILKQNEPAPRRAVIVGLYGEPGVSKTSISNTSNKVILLDFDRGYDRSVQRKDTFIVESWIEVRDWIRKGGHKEYETVVIDTTKACLDDFLSLYVRTMDPKNEKSGGGLSLAGYGAIADEFKHSLVEPLRQSGVDLILISHAKIEDQGEVKRHIMDVTGGSSQLITRIADQIGYVSIVGGVRVIKWNPSDTTVGKNVAGLPTTEVPPLGDRAFENFFAEVIQQIKDAIAQKSDAQRQAEELDKQLREDIEAATEVGHFNLLIENIKQLPKYLAVPLAEDLKVKAESLGFAYNKERKGYFPSEEGRSGEVEIEPEEGDGEVIPADPKEEKAPKKAAKRTVKKDKAEEGSDNE